MPLNDLLQIHFCRTNGSMNSSHSRVDTKDKDTCLAITDESLRLFVHIELLGVVQARSVEHPESHHASAGRKTRDESPLRLTSKHLARIPCQLHPSSDADASVLLSDEKATALTKREWPSSVCSSAPEPASQSWIVPSSDTDSSVFPSGEKATALTLLEWSSSVCSKLSQLFLTSGDLRIH